MRQSHDTERRDIGRVLVVGGSGRVGTVLRRAWRATGQGGLVWQDRQGGMQSFDALDHPERFADAARGADAIFNLAGRTGADRAALALNTDLALAALEAGRAASVPRVFLVSSAAVYGPTDGPADEAAPLVPGTAYGKAKARMEKAARAWVADHPAAAPAVTILRFCNIAGTDQLLGAQPGPEPQGLDVFADGHGPARSYIGPTALADILARIFAVSKAGGALPDTLNVALLGTVRMEELLEADGRGWRARPAPPQLPRMVELDVRRLTAIIGSHGKADPRAIIADFRASCCGRG